MNKLLNKEGINKKELLKPKIDVVFRTLFREENKRITEGLISDILEEKVKIKTTDLNPHLNAKLANQKIGIMDLRTELEDGTKCNIEIQLVEQKKEKERFLYYWADAYSRQLRRGEEYEELKKTISIIILDHEINELEGIEELDTKWQIRDNKTGKRLLTDHLEIIIIEIPKAIKQYKKNEKNKISQWMIFIDNPNKEEVGKIMEENETIKEAVEELTQMSEDEELRLIAELKEKERRDKNAAISFAEEKGLQQGLQHGRKEEKIGIAKNMLKKRMAIEDIIEVTGLSREEIEELL